MRWKGTGGKENKIMEKTTSQLTEKDLKWAIGKHEAQIYGSQAYLNGLEEPYKSQFKALLDRDQKCIDAMSGDPAAILAETEKFITEEENMPLDQNFTKEQRGFYFDRRMLIRNHPRAEAVFVRYQLSISNN